MHLQAKLEQGNLACYINSPTTLVSSLHPAHPHLSGRLPSSLVKEHSQHTIGVEFSSRTVKLGEKRIKLQVRVHDMVSSLYCLTGPEVMGYCWSRAIQVR